MIVMKFGGTSVADSRIMRTVIGIVADHAERKPLLVSSACAGVTNTLLEIADAAAEGDEVAVQEKVGHVRDRHLTCLAELLREWPTAPDEVSERATSQVSQLCDELQRLAEGVMLLRECTRRSRANILSFGERVSTTILTAGFSAAGHKNQLIDARSLLLTDSMHMNASVDMDATRQRCTERVCPVLAAGSIAITQGFIGADIRGITTTNGRGGSDLSAAIFGAALGAEEIQIWTDVSGVYTADPRVVDAAHTIPRITFDEAGELAYFGAKVLHPDTIRPAIADKIPVRVRNTFDAAHAGTLLVADALPDVDGIRALAIRKHMILLSFAMRSANQTSRILAAVYGALTQRGLEAFAAQGSEHHYVLCLEDAQAAMELAEEFRDFADVSITEAAVICAVGPRVAGANGASVVAQLSEVLQPFNSLFVQHHVGNISILAAVPDESGHAALRAAHTLIS